MAQATQNKKFVNSKDKLGVPPEDNRYILKRVWLSKEEETVIIMGSPTKASGPFAITLIPVRFSARRIGLFIKK